MGWRRVHRGRPVSWWPGAMRRRRLADQEARNAAVLAANHAGREQARVARQDWWAAVDALRPELPNEEAHWLVDLLDWSVTAHGPLARQHGPVPPDDVLAGVLAAVGGGRLTPGWERIREPDVRLLSGAGMLAPDEARLARLREGMARRAEALGAVRDRPEYAPHAEAERLWTEVSHELVDNGMGGLPVRDALAQVRWWPGASEVSGGPSRPDPLGVRQVRGLMESRWGDAHLWYEQYGRANAVYRRTDVDPVRWVLASMAYAARETAEGRLLG